MEACYGGADVMERSCVLRCGAGNRHQQVTKSIKVRWQF
jgi:hypothetical protein